MSSTTDLTLIDEIKQTSSPCTPLDDVPSRYQVAWAFRALAKRKAVGPDGLPAWILKALADEGESETLVKLNEVVVAMWEGGGAPQK